MPTPFPIPERPRWQPLRSGLLIQNISDFNLKFANLLCIFHV